MDHNALLTQLGYNIDETTTEHMRRILNNTDGLRSAGYIYEYGLGVNKNLEKAIYFYEKATSLGSSEASYDLGLIYLGKNDYKKARIYLDEACYHGKEEACTKLKEMKF